MKAYMDDTNTAGIGQGWLQQTQAMWESLVEMGLVIAKHHCISIRYRDGTYSGASAAELIHEAIATHGP